MRILPPVSPTSEQLVILSDTKPGFVLIRGAAGSGKTTTALYRLQQLCASWIARRDRQGSTSPVRVLVLTYNRTLEGYVSQLAQQQIPRDPNLVLNVATFGRWSTGLLRNPQILDNEDSRHILRPLISRLPGNFDFLADEIDYAMGRFEPENLELYVTARREGRGAAPRVDQSLRRRILDEAIYPYMNQKQEQQLLDWNDVAIAAGKVDHVPPWDVVIVDESQDFSANQVRTILRHLADPFSLTFVMDAAQRIYPRYFSWREAGIETFRKKHLLKSNHRNTRQIAAFARPLVEGLPLDDDGALPEFNSCGGDGPKPLIVAGIYSKQLSRMIGKIRTEIDLDRESVAFLQPKGGGYFRTLRSTLSRSGIPWVELTRASEWPNGPEQVAICTIASAKGLEFDHVFMPGLNREVTPHGQEAGDAQLEQLRRLVAMGVGRARKSVVIGYKPDDPSTILSALKPDTYDLELV